MRNPCLSAFIDLLEHGGLMRFDILGEDEQNFRNRFMIQKYVYLAKYFGLDMGYGFSMYLHGPYSRTLADDYYELAESEAMDKAAGFPITRTSDLNGLDQASFYNFVDGKDLEWLEAASTLLSLRPHFNERRLLLERTANMKEHIPQNIIESILGTLETNGLVSTLH